MSKAVNIQEAKTHLSRLVHQAAMGKEVIISKAGKPMARLVPLEAVKPKKLGMLKGKINVPDEFNLPLDPTSPGSFRSAVNRASAAGGHDTPDKR
jgi:prevent-host-death family protein